MNTKKTKNQKTAKPKHIVALANPKGGEKDNVKGCWPAVHLPGCNGEKTVNPCSSCKADCKWACMECKPACMQADKYGPYPSSEAAPTPKKVKTETKQDMGRPKKK
ncbi:MAG: hypothetical protein CVU68_08785 [Deltaproteobacteria bacterium HGW-Deltaproteobacteria-3]|nr:MAG: hypothetical protein CVU68_08785 [Deltaproteobacteria bacterium HGW-Deltaproteobacteria-3]